MKTVTRRPRNVRASGRLSTEHGGRSMRPTRSRFRPAAEPLDDRLLPSAASALVLGPFTVGATGRHATTGPYLLSDVNGDGRVNLTDEQLFVQAYDSKLGDKNYNPAADLNHNGQVGQGDARLL